MKTQTIRSWAYYPQMCTPGNNDPKKSLDVFMFIIISREQITMLRTCNILSQTITCIPRLMVSHRPKTCLKSFFFTNCPNGRHSLPPGPRHKNRSAGLPGKKEEEESAPGKSTDYGFSCLLSWSPSLARGPARPAAFHIRPPPASLSHSYLALRIAAWRQYIQRKS